MSDKSCDPDIENMSLDELKQSLQKARDLVRDIFKPKGHNACWFHSELAEILPEKVELNTILPPEIEFKRNCDRFNDYVRDKAPTFNTKLSEKQQKQWDEIVKTARQYPSTLPDQIEISSELIEAIDQELCLRLNHE